MKTKGIWYMTQVRKALPIGMLLPFLVLASCSSPRSTPLPSQPVRDASHHPAQKSSVQAQAWIYPNAPCDASQAYTTEHISILKPQYFTLEDTGLLKPDTVANSGCNGYSPQEAASVKQFSQKQFVTISSTTSSMTTLATSPSLVQAFIKRLRAFLGTTGFTGVELDFEGYSAWTQQEYTAYKALVRTVGDALHAHGYQLMLDGPGIGDEQTQSYYRWRYEDFNSLPVDYLVALAYDQQYDNGAGTPVQSLNWLRAVCTWMTQHVTDPQKIVLGIPSYGYHGPTGSTNGIKIDTYSQSKTYPGFAKAQRDPASGEMMWREGGISYDYSDTQTLDDKLQIVEQAGISQISVWHLGGNAWFSPLALQSSPPTKN
jgi:spore germination protein YaaH